MRAQLAVGLAVCLVAVGCGAEADERVRDGPQPDVRVVQAAPVTAAIEGGTPAQRELLGEILAGLDSDRIVRVAILEPHPDLKPFDAGDVMLSVEYAGDGPDTRAHWESWLVAGVFQYRSHTLGLPGVVWLEEGGGGNRLEYRPHPIREPGGDPAAVVERVEQAAAVAGADVARIEILQPFGFALAITLRVPDAPEFLHDRLEGFLIELEDRWQRWEGTLIEVVDAQGRPVWRTAGGSRMSIGAGWTAPELAGCWPHHGIGSGPIGAPPPPPCPTSN
jgi:hypothetical protein